MNEKFLAGADSREMVITSEMVDNTLHPQMTVCLDKQGSSLKVKSLAMAFNKITALLITIDLLFMSSKDSRHLRDKISRVTGVAVENIILSYSHSHSTPVLDSTATGKSIASAESRNLYNYICSECVSSAQCSFESLRPARVGYGLTHVVGASFSTQVRISDDKVKMTRDYREGLAAGGPIDPRLSVLRIDDESGGPIAGWIRFSAHPACVIFDAMLSAEYPGYMTDHLSKNFAGGAVVLYSYGAAGDVNCVPMFGSEEDSCNLGIQLGELAGKVFTGIETQEPKRFGIASGVLEVPLSPVPSIRKLECEIREVEAFVRDVDKDSSLSWALGCNCSSEWSPEQKKAYVRPLAEWARKMKQAVESGTEMPKTWPNEVTALIIDDIGFLFYSGEAFTELSFTIATASSLRDVLLMCQCNGAEGYLGPDHDRIRGGYQLWSWPRYAMLGKGRRPLPYAIGAADVFVDGCLSLLNEISSR